MPGVKEDVVEVELDVCKKCGAVGLSRFTCTTTLDTLLCMECREWRFISNGAVVVDESIVIHGPLVKGITRNDVKRCARGNKLKDNITPLISAACSKCIYASICDDMVFELNRERADRDLDFMRDGY